MKTAPLFTNCIHRLLERFVLLLIALLIGSFAVVQKAQAVLPAPDGGYDGGNTAEGTNALFTLTTGVWNTASGFEALKNDTTGNTNTAAGYNALFSNLTGGGNTAIGSRALVNNATGSHNIAVGANAGINITTGSSNIDIGNSGIPADSNTIRIGVQNTQTSTFIAGISGSAVAAPEVRVTPGGKLGIIVSSARFKNEIKPMDKASETLFALKPVSFRYKKEIDPTGISRLGLVAEDVEKVNPDLVVRDKEGKPYSVRYDQVNAMLLNEFLKEHRKVQEQETTIAQLKSAVMKQEATATEQQKEIADLTTTVKEQAAQIQKVSAQLEASKPAPQLVNSDQ
jgi:trimeric autotransporter adhesin